MFQCFLAYVNDTAYKRKLQRFNLLSPDLVIVYDDTVQRSERAMGNRGVLRRNPAKAIRRNDAMRQQMPNLQPMGGHFTGVQRLGSVQPFRLEWLAGLTEVSVVEADDRNIRPDLAGCIRSRVGRQVWRANHRSCSSHAVSLFVRTPLSCSAATRLSS
ncbi:hypothetical protein [Paenibacillus baekrokdamisoli]|uniref:hypothetical protein n=1 Tax=Paenibacillus baekrokdamisoli TaxID=1712516 RepID=UPI0013DEE072|nr:hypothetical protein [Paenibacillus baekrokdamisoli]